MKEFNVECYEVVTITYNVEVEAENEDEARDKVYNNFWDLNYQENDYETEGITINTITEITNYHEDDGITCQ